MEAGLWGRRSGERPGRVAAASLFDGSEAGGGRVGAFRGDLTIGCG